MRRQKKMYFTTNKMGKHEKEEKKKARKQNAEKDAQTEGVEINTNISIIPANKNLSN